MRPCLLIAAGLALAGCAAKEEPTPKAVVAVRVARAELADVRQTVRAPASIFPREQANVAGRITAPIRALRVRKGDRVAAGQVLAELENRDLLAQRSEARAAVADAEANLEKVTAGTLPADVERARGQVATTEAALNQAQKFYERREELYRKGAIPQRDLLVSQTELAQAKTAHEVARKSLELLERQSRDRDIQIARSRLDQARARLSLIEAQLQFAEIRSPFAGNITEQFMYPGDMAKPDAPIFTVMDLSMAIARAQVPEADGGAVRLGQACVFASTDFPGGEFGGKVAVINQAVDPARRTIETWCEIPNSHGRLRAGVFGSATIVTGVAARSVVVPLAAVQFVEGTRKGVVFVADKQRAVKKEIEAGEMAGGRVQIRRGLEAGELVIVEGAYALPDGAEIRVDGGAEKK